MSFAAQASPTSWAGKSSGSGTPVFPHSTFFPPSVETKHSDHDSTEFDESDSGEESFEDSAVDLGKHEIITKNGSDLSRSKQPTAQPANVPQQQQNQGRKESMSAESTVSLVEEIRKMLKEKEELKTNEIRKIIQEELGQIHTTGTAAAPTGGESHVYQARNVTQQKIPPNITLQPPSGGSTRAPSPRQNRPRSYTNETSASSQPEMSPRSTTGVQWSSTVPLVSSPGGWSSSPTSTRFPVEVSAVDVKWGQLFDDKGVETKRLGQILGGTGQYILDEFLPQNTLLITPDKLASFYSQHKTDPEPFPFVDIFRNRALSQSFYSKLEDLYRHLGCEYYLSPSTLGTRPTVPGLTLAGWIRWMTVSIRSYPDEEHKRFANVVAALPINAVSLLDGKLERLPKQISRHLFPERPDFGIHTLLSRAMEGFMMRSPPHAARPASPRSRYKPSGSTGVPSPPPSSTGDDSDSRRDHRERREKERRDSYGGTGRTYESNGGVRRDPLPRSNTVGSRPSSRTAGGAGLPPPPPPPPPSSGGRRGDNYQRHSVSGSVSGYPAPFGRSVSDANVYVTERERERERERDRERGRESKSRGRDKESERRERDRTRGSARSASVASFDRRRRSRRGSTVVIKDDRDRDRDGGRRSPSWGE